MTLKALQDSGTPTGMSDADATRFGLKAYFHGTTYNGGVNPSWGGTNWTTSHGVVIPYQMQDASWRLKFNFVGSFSGASSSNVTNAITLNGVTTGANPTYQAITVNDQGTQSRAAAVSASIVASSSGQIQLLFGASTNFNNTWAFSGDIALSAKPTFAY